MLAAACVAFPASAANRPAMPAPSRAAAHPAPADPAFDVAAIRENHSDPTARSHIIRSPRDGHLTVTHVPMKMLLQFASALPETRIVGGPDWLNSIKLDIEAKADSSVDDRLGALSCPPGDGSRRRSR
jgi:hypothetical protein